MVVGTVVPDEIFGIVVVMVAKVVWVIFNKVVVVVVVALFVVVVEDGVVAARFLRPFSDPSAVSKISLEDRGTERF